MILGIFTAVLLVIYLGIVVWAYSGRRRDDFAAAAQLPLVEGGAENRNPERRENATGEAAVLAGSGRGTAGAPGPKHPCPTAETPRAAGGRIVKQQMFFVASDKELHP